MTDCFFQKVIGPKKVASDPLPLVGKQLHVPESIVCALVLMTPMNIAKCVASLVKGRGGGRCTQARDCGSPRTAMPGPSPLLLWGMKGSVAPIVSGIQGGLDVEIVPASLESWQNFR